MLTNSFDEFELGERIKKAWKKKKKENEKEYTREKFAERLGVTTTTISQWCSGQRTPRLSNLIDICDYLEIDIGYLLKQYDEKTLSTHELCRITGLSEYAIEKLIRIKSTNKASGLSNVLSLFICHPCFEKMLSLLSNPTKGTLDLVSFGNNSFLIDKEALINSDLKDTTIEIANYIRKEYTPNDNSIAYSFLYGMYHGNRISKETLQEIEEEYDKGNYDYVPKGEYLIK